MSGRALLAALLAVLLLGGVTAAGAAPRRAPASQKTPASRGLLTAAELIEKVEKARAGQETLVGEFTQRKRLSLFRDELRSTGRFAFRSPGKLRWEYLTPDPSVILLDGARVTVKTPGQKSVTYDLGRQPGLKALLERLLAALGPGSLKAATQDFDLKVTGPQALLLVPRGDLAKHLVAMEMRFDAAWQVAGLALREKNGDQTDVTFAGLKRNVKVDDAAFRP
ncbi:MAG: outer membrane lipoprotein carrier protein LolA [Deltaproteobacteria bacterium]|nr:outer membrane lipoprotein carrier protein LolA [Deltaproteobacteria bacterium]